MSNTAAQPVQPPADPAFDRAQRRLARLARTADLALELVEATQAKALAAIRTADETETPGREAVDFIHAFDRAARAVRLCSLLEARFEGDLAVRAEACAETARRRAGAEAKADEARRLAGRPPREVRRDALREIVGFAIEAEAAEANDEDKAARDRTLRETALNERLDREWDDARHLDRPVGVVVKDLCDSLGLAPDWALLENEDWAIAETVARTPGSPFADWPLPWEGAEPQAPPPPAGPAGGPGP